MTNSLYLIRILYHQLKSFSNFQNERQRIVTDMEKSSPHPYENLLFSEYPDKNQAKVNELALKNVTLKTLKEETAEQINKQIEPKVEEKTANLPELARMAARKAIKKVVNEAVDKAFDAATEAIMKKNAQTKS